MTTENGKPSTHRALKAKATTRALDDVDQRIVVALAERDEASRKVSLLIYWQDRLQRVNQDIDSLISIQQRLSGTVANPPVVVAPMPPPVNLAIPYSHTAAIPTGVSSVPRQANPLPSGSNVAAEVEGDNDFR